MHRRRVIRQILCTRHATRRIPFLSYYVSCSLAPLREFQREESRIAMFLVLAVVLVVLWLGGFLLFHTAGFLIHLLLLFAVISLVMHFITGRSTV